MSGLGEQIATAREQRGLTAADAAERLHIRTDYINAIEGEAWTKLGAPAYARGFVRNYARLVGIDPSAISAALDEAIPVQAPACDDIAARSLNAPFDAPSHNDNGAVEFIRPSRSSATNWYPYLLSAMSALAALLVIAVLYYTFGPAPRALQAQAPAAQPVAATLAPQDEAVVSGGVAGVAQAAGQTAGVDLQLQLTQDSWLSVTVDGKQVVYETLPAGTIREFHGVREIALRAGNAGGVSATIDGRPLGTLGQHGQVEDRLFAAKSAVAPLSSGPRE